MSFDFEPYRSLLILCQELRQDNQLGIAGPVLMGNPLPTSPLQAHRTPLPTQISFILCVFFNVLGLHPPSCHFCGLGPGPNHRKRHHVQWHYRNQSLIFTVVKVI